MTIEGKEGRLRLILRLARLHFLIPGFLLYLFGFFMGAMRGGATEAGVFLFGYSIFFTAHLSVHFSNDYYDREGDRLGRSNVLSGGSGVLVRHRELERHAIFLALSFLLGSVALAGVFTVLYAFPPSFFAFAVLGALLGWFYSAPPLRFSSRRMSELTTCLAAGFIMPGMGYFVSSGSIDPWFVILSLPLACYALFFIITVEMPDMEADMASGKRNLLTDHGRKAGVGGSLLATAAGALLLFTIIASGVLGNEALFVGLALFSIIPLAGATSALFNSLSSPEDVYRQAKINMASLMLFLMVSDLYLMTMVFL